MHAGRLAARRALLDLPHMVPLRAFAAGLRACGPVPDFDPLDGGVQAEALFLLEKPGPMTMGGSGLVSRDNPTATAAAIASFMVEAGLARERTILWNAVPWWNGTMRITSVERRDGLATLPRLLALLHHLRAAVLVGGTAAHARPALSKLEVFSSAHPSPQVRAAFPDRWRAIPSQWARVRAHLDAAASTTP